MFGNIMLTHRPKVDLVAILKAQLSNSLWKIVAWALAKKLLSCECHRISLMISQCWFRYWLDGVRQQVITWANVDPTPCCHMASLGHVELKSFMFWVRSRTVPIWMRYMEYCGFWSATVKSWCSEINKGSQPDGADKGLPLDIQLYAILSYTISHTKA